MHEDVEERCGRVYKMTGGNADPIPNTAIIPKQNSQQDSKLGFSPLS